MLQQLTLLSSYFSGSHLAKAPEMYSDEFVLNMDKKSA